MALTSDNSETGIANEALSAAMVPSILSSLDQPNSKAARVCRLHLPAVRDEILRAHGFAFARQMVALSAVSPAPVGGEFTTAFPWPEDALRIISIDGLTKRQWRPVTGHQILASTAGPVTVQYIASIGNFGLWDALARRMMVVSLAVRVAPELTRTRAAKQDLIVELQQLSDLAPKIDAYEQDSEQDDGDYDAYVPAFIAARF